ncbi:unnamed protein product [Cuscuta campestris]|uniref:C2 domain-containing protein n=1 Tax=Cuscuta campestris TaxID=132261 RepID=A0A484LLA0_9ASTE|nr:unnamed protein product [Cuscuta campestris]
MLMGSRDRSNMEDPDGTLASVAQLIEKLRKNSASMQEKEALLMQLLELINTRDNAFSAVGSHSQAVPVLVSLLRSGSFGVKMQAATVLGSLCKENELRVKVLLGGCIPPLLGLLKSSSTEGQIAAAKTIYAVSQGGAKDHVGSKIFSTEGVVPVLWQQLQKGLKAENLVDDLITGSLKNLCTSTEGFWSATNQAGGVDILVKLLATGQSSTQANVCFLLASIMMEDSSVCSKVLASDVTQQLLKLLGPNNKSFVRAESAGALKSLSAQSKEARREIANLNGIPVLINATIAPSKEFMQGEHAQALQENAMCALANISGGLSYVISSLGQSLESCSSSAQVSDTLGALASALMIYDIKAENARASDPLEVEQTLVKQFKPQLPLLVQERTIEALASLYGNAILSRKLANSDAKRLLIGLITMASNEVQDELIRSLLILCKNEGSLWHALQGREGIQLLISLLGLSSEQQQECAVALLCLLSDENDESKWAITAAGGIPPLVQILETGSSKAKEDSVTILGNLCNHSEDIRECVESADAVPALLWLLKNGSSNGKEIAAKTLNHLIHKSDTATISQLTALLASDLPESKVYVLAALRNLLSMVPLNDILREGRGRAARYSAAKALENLFSADHIRNAESVRHSVKPLVEILNSGLEKEQHAAIAALVRLLSENPSRALAVADVEMNAVEVLCRILSSNCSMELKGDAAELCSVLFTSTRVRSTIAAARCVEPLVSLLVTEFSPAHHSVVHALDKLVDDEQLAELVAAHGAVIPLVGLLYGQNYMLHEAISRTLVKLGKDRPSCKLEMVKAGVIESILDILHEAPHFLCAAFSELLRILTNNAAIAKGPSAAKVVEPLFFLLTAPEFGHDGQHSALQVLVNILEHPQCRADYTLTSHQAIEPLIPLLDSPASAVQQLAAELLSHLLMEEHLQKDPVTQQVIGPLVRVLGSDIPILQQRAVKALVCVSVTWPNEIAKEGGVSELSKVLLNADPLLPNALWESAASVLASILQFSSEFYLEVPVAVLVRLLRSGLESTILGALNALLVLESDDSTSAVAMAESGAIEALLELLRCHICEETAARLLEVLLNNVKIRDTKVTKSAILPLSQYLLDPQTQGQQARFMATLALGALFQNESLARTSDAVSACRALVNLLEDQPTEEMKVVSICALQNLVMYSRSNKRAVAEAGGVQVVLDVIGSSDPDTSVQAAMFIKLLFSNNTIQEYASGETVRAITAALEKDLWATGTVNEEYLKALNALFGNFPRLRATEPATLSIPHLVTALKTGSEATQEAALDALYLLRHAWSACPAEVSRAQSIAAADAIPLLQYLIQSGPPRFQEKAEFLLQCLPGTLVVIIKRGNNMRQSVGNPSVYCKLTLGNTPPLQTKVASTGPNPEWDESFAWSFESPPKGQKLHISCKNKSKIGKSSFGKVTIQIDRVVMLGAVSGEYTLLPESKSGPSRNLEIEFQWSNKTEV